MSEKQPIIDIPGLSDHIGWHGQRHFGNRLNREPDFDVHYLFMNWHEGPYDEKEDAGLDLVDRLYDEYGVPVAVVGHSAGGHPASRLLALRPDKVSCAVLICAEIEHPEHVAGAFEKNPAFQQSLELVPDTKRRLNKLERTHDVISLRPWVDRRVPPADTIFPGADNRLVRFCGIVPTLGHSLSIPAIYRFGTSNIADPIRQRSQSS